MLGSILAPNASAAPPPPPPPPPPSTWSNGYLQRYSVVISGDRVPGTTALSGFLFRYKATLPSLRSEANGGTVKSASGWDIRFEDADGVKLPHRFLSTYSPTTGAVDCLVLVPSVAAVGQTVIYRFTGKTLAATEEDVAGVYADYVDAFNCRTGASLKGVTARNLAAVGTVGTGTVIGDAGTYAAGHLRSSETAWFSGYTAMTMQVVVDGAASMTGDRRGPLGQGPQDGVTTNHGFGFRYQTTGQRGGGTNIIAGHINTAAGIVLVESAANVHATGIGYWAMVYQSGQVGRLNLNGVATNPTFAGTVAGSTVTPGGTVSSTTLATAGSWFIGQSIGNFGAAGSAINGNWLTGADEVRFRDDALSDDHLMAEYLSWSEPELFFGEGDADYVSATNFAVVAVPDVAATTRNTPVTIDILANDYDPEGATITLSSLSSPTNGTVAQVAGQQARFTPSSGFTGTGGFTYLISDPAGHTSTGRVSVSVTAPSVGSAYTYEWGLPWIPASDSDIDISYVQTNGSLQTAAGAAFTSTGSITKMLLLVAPSATITGNINHTNLRYRSVVMIGASFVPNATHSHTFAGVAVPGMARIVQLDFANAGYAVDKPPTLWLSNVELNCTNTYWGDFFRIGTTANASSTNINDFMVGYWQKFSVPRGHYGGSGTPSNDVPHSDFCQKLNSKSFRHLYFADCDIRWAYQIFFTKSNETGAGYYPDGSINFNRVICRGQSNTANPYTMQQQQLYLTFTNFDSAAADLASGRYATHNIANFHCAANPDGTPTTSTSYFSASGMTATRVTTTTPQTLTYTHTKPSNRAFRCYEGEPINFHLSETTLPSYVSSTDVGHALRVTTPAQLRAIFPNASST